MLQLYVAKTIAKKDLHIGSLYIYKSGRVVIYLGRNSQGRFMFYIVGAVYLEESIRFDGFILYYEDIEFNCLSTKVTTLLKKPMQKELLIESIGIPVLLYEIPFMTEDSLYTLFAKRKLLGLPTVNLTLNKDFDAIDNPKPIKAKDLKIGYAYVEKRNIGTIHEGHNAVIYLGKGITGCYTYLKLSAMSEIESHKGFPPIIESLSHFKDYYIESHDNPKIVYAPIYYRKWGEIDTTQDLKQYGFLQA